MYLDVKARISNKFWARHMADTVAEGFGGRPVATVEVLP